MRVTHKPTGIQATVDGRDQHKNKRDAIKEIERRIAAHFEKQRGTAKKARRDHAIHNEVRVRTYDYSRGVVTDHRTGKTASIKDIVVKGKLDKLR